MAGFNAKTARFVKRYAVSVVNYAITVQYAQEFGRQVFTPTNTVQPANRPSARALRWRPGCAVDGLLRSGRASRTHRRRVRQLSQG